MEKVFRPWGYYENLKEGEGYKVKQITVEGEQQISLQYHYYRSEYWTVVRGDGYVEIGDKMYRANIHSTFKVSEKETHRLKAGENGIDIIEVQIGSQCNEEDIVRLLDDYDRV